MTKKKIYICIAVLVVVSAALNFHLIFALGHYYSSTFGRMRCQVSIDWYYFVYNIFSYIQLLKFTIMPFLLILIGNICIIGRMIHAKRNARNLNTNQDNSGQVSQMTFLLLGISVTFIILNSPISILIILDYVWSLNQNIFVRAQLYLAVNIGNFLYNSNSAINFYIYCLTGSRFRSEFKSLFRKRGSDPNNDTSTTSSTVTRSKTIE